MSDARPRTLLARPPARIAAAITAGLVVTAGVTAMNLGAGSAASKAPKLTHEQVAKALLEHRSRFMSASGAAGLRFAAGEDRPAFVFGGGDEAGAAAGAARAGSAPAAALASAKLTNVRVNDPKTDPFIEQTIQSETSLAVHGKRVAVGYNDLSHVLPAGLTAGANASGYSYSTNGGASFTDGGTLPQEPGYINLGDPWLGSDRAGKFYYSSLYINGQTGNLEIAVYPSTNGGRSWGTPAVVSPNDPNLFYSGDKEALAVGRSKASAAKDSVYVAWDDFGFDPTNGDSFAGLPVAHSEDGGATWSLNYADKIVSDPTSCSFGQYIGSQPIVDPASGTLYVVSLKIAVDDPTCTGGTLVFQQVAFRSDDGGQTFSAGVPIATVGDFFDIDLGVAKVARSLPLPTVTIAGGTLIAAWNEGPDDGSRIRWSGSADGGATWSPTVTVPAASGEDFQPALTADSRGLHLAYYHRNDNRTVDVILADSANGSSWRAKRVTSKAFPGVFTVPPFDPNVAFGYMGDYIANVASGGHDYLAWGDNRDIVKNVLWPAGRNDPDVFFARR